MFYSTPGLFENAVADFGIPDIFIHNAAIINEYDWEPVLAVNLVCCLYVDIVYTCSQLKERIMLGRLLIVHKCLFKTLGGVPLFC